MFGRNAAMWAGGGREGSTGCIEAGEMTDDGGTGSVVCREKMPRRLDQRCRDRLTRDGRTCPASGGERTPRVHFRREKFGKERERLLCNFESILWS